ncbi:MAG: EAL domain-containing protein [Gammaproteobacteria bacterium]|nr:EAL domain-containing protein [Gammaproteobacteria bacterium]
MIELREIYDALNDDEFFLVYQPIVALDDARWVGVEALIRWQRGGGLVMPSDFIPLAENTPLSGLITYWVIERVAVELGAWLKANDDLFVSINVPPEILGRGGLEYASRRSGLRDLSHQIVLEITERGIPDRQGADALELITTYSSARIALDDVMLSGANIAVLSRLTFDFVKIHPALVQEIALDGNIPAWLAHLADLQKSAPLQLIAEGIENVGQAEALRQSGIQMGQGYYFSRPRGVDELTRLLPGRRL